LNYLSTINVNGQTFKPMKTKKLIQVITCQFWSDEPSKKIIYLFNGYISIQSHAVGIKCYSIEFSLNNRVLNIGMGYCKWFNYDNGKPSKLSFIRLRLGKPLISIYTTKEERDRQNEATAKYIV
jgi:hypothetical protein